MMKLIIWGIVFSAALSLSIYKRYPASSSAGQFNTNDTLVLSYSKTKFDNNKAIAVTFDSVAADSRCPEGVRCIWAGKVDVALTALSPGNQPFSCLLHLPGNSSDTLLYNSVRIKLLKVDPYPVKGKTIKPANYTITLCIYQKQ